MTFSQFLNLLNSRKYSIVFIFFLTVALTVLITNQLPKTYKATASVVVNIKGVDLITGNSIRVPLNTHINVIKSHSVALKVVDRLSLYTQQSYISRFLKANKGDAKINDFIADDLAKNLSVFAVPGNSVVKISYESSSPKFAATVANAFVDAYIKTILELNSDPSKRTAKWFEMQVEQIRNKLFVAQKALIAYQQDKGIVDAENSVALEINYLSKLNTQLFEAEAEYQELKIQLNDIKPDLSNLNDVIKDQGIEEIRRDLIKTELEFYQIISSVSKNHPDYKRLSAQVSSLRSLLKRERETIHKRLITHEITLKNRINTYKESISKQKNKLMFVNNEVQELNNLKKQVEESQFALDMAVKRLNEIALQGKSSESEISILNQASEPVEHYKPKMLINVLLGAVFGLVLAIGVAMIRELVNRKVRTDDDVIVSVGLPILGHVIDASTKR